MHSAGKRVNYGTAERYRLQYISNQDIVRYGGIKMNRRTNKKLKQEIRSLPNEVNNLYLRAWLNDKHYYHQHQVFVVKAVVSMRDCLYPEQAYPQLRRLILRQLEDNIDEFIENYRDDITDSHVAEFRFIPCYRKGQK